MDRRAQKKARTRVHIRTVAQRMFAEGGFDAVTIADIAREADVAVQTIFNHFATKEELFFDGRIPWVEGPADAVRRRPPGTSPLTALRRHLVEGAGHFVSQHLSAEGRAFTATVAACPTLASHEQRVIQEAERALSAALAEAWLTDPEPGADHRSTSTIVAPLTAAIWLAAARVVFVEHRRCTEADEDLGDRVARVERLVDRTLAGIQSQIDTVPGTQGTGARSDTGWPPPGIRRAG